MANEFFTILTATGRNKLAAATATGTALTLNQMAVGDGDNGAYYSPTEAQTALKHEVWRGAINHLAVDANNPNWIVAELVIPDNVGGFYIREVGLFDSTGAMIAVGKFPESYKPTLAAGSNKQLYVRMLRPRRVAWSSRFPPGRGPGRAATGCASTRSPGSASSTLGSTSLLLPVRRSWLRPTGEWPLPVQRPGTGISSSSSTPSKVSSSPPDTPTCTPMASACPWEIGFTLGTTSPMWASTATPLALICTSRSVPAGRGPQRSTPSPGSPVTAPPRSTRTPARP